MPSVQSDAIVVTGPELAQVNIGLLPVTPTGGEQTTLANALAVSMGAADAIEPGTDLSLGAVTYNGGIGVPLNSALDGLAPTASATFTGTVVIPTLDVTVGATIPGFAQTNSPSFTGIPAAPTANPGTNSTQLATTAFVQSAVSASTTGVSSFNTRTGAIVLTSGDVTTALTFTPYNSTNPSGYQTASQVTTALAPYATLASPTFTGTPVLPSGTTGTTQTTGTSNTTLATTQFVQSAVTTTGTTWPPASVTAAGTTLGGATQLTSTFAVVATPTNGAGVKIQNSINVLQMVYNSDSANVLQVYPSSLSMQFDNFGNGTAVSIPAGQAFGFIVQSSSQVWVVFNNNPGGTTTPATTTTLGTVSVPVSGSLLVAGGAISAVVGSDDPTNVSGLGASALRNGMIFAHLVTGVTTGSGALSQATQTATLNALVSALAYGASNNKPVVFLPFVFQIYGTLQIPLTNGLQIIGSPNCQIVQYQANVPGVIFGDSAGNNPPFGQIVSGGMQVSYGVSQTGNTSAFAIQMGAAYYCVWANLVTSGYASNPPYIAWYLKCAAGSNQFFFQNKIIDCYFNGGQQNLVSWNVVGTGNEVTNIYTVNGGSTATSQQCNGPAWYFGNSQNTTDNVFTRCNIEHVKTNQIFSIGANNGYLDSAVMSGFHLEGITLTGSSPCVFRSIGGGVKLLNFLVLDLQVDSAATSPSFIFPAGFGEHYDFDGLTLRWDSASSNVIGKTFLMVNPGGAIPDAPPTIIFRRLRIEDDPGNNANYLQMDANMTQNQIVGNYSYITEYFYDYLLPWTKQAVTFTQTNYTHYGQHEKAIILTNATLSAAFTITLSNWYKASGTGSQLPTPMGTWVRFRRQSGTFSYAVTFVDGASGSTITTNSTSGTDLVFMFNGANYVQVS